MTDSETIHYLKNLIERDLRPRIEFLESQLKREGWFRRLVRAWLGD